jgi:6-phosphogluconate dehydrogenase
VFKKLGLKTPAPVKDIDKAQLISDVKAALYASKICSYAQVGGLGRWNTGWLA